MLSNLGHFLHRRRNLAAILVLGFVVLAGAWGAAAQSKLTVSRDDFDAPGTESVLAQKNLEAARGASPEPDFVALVHNDAAISGPAGTAQVQRVVSIIEQQAAVAQVAAPNSADDATKTPISADGHDTIVAAYFKPIDGTAAQKVAEDLKQALAAVPGVQSGGPLLVYKQLNDQVKHDSSLAEVLAFPVLLLLSLLFFRGVVAATLPLMIALISVIGSLAVLRTVTEFTSVSIFAVNLVTALGLGLAIDYSLFIVNRYREELAVGGPPEEILARTLSSAGRTVAFSSMTVTLAFLGMMVFPQQTIRSMGIGGLSVGVFSGLAALLALPVVLAKLGPRVNALAPARLQRSARRSAEPDENGGWYRLAAFVMRRAVPVALISALVLIVLGIPVLGIKFGRPDARVLPASASARQVTEQINTIFGSNTTAPIVVAVQAPAGADQQVNALADTARTLPGVAAVQPPQQVAPGLWQLNVISRGDAVSADASSAVRALRALSVPDLQLSVGGEPARYIDQQTSIGHRLPVALAILVGTALIVLLVMTGSVVLPIKALLMNLLTLSATFGVLVFVFQHGHLERALDFTSSGALEPETMVLLFIVAFALTTDYGVFLLGRIKEARDSGLPNTTAVAHGLERTGRIVTAAALLMCVALGSLMVSKIEYIKELGLGAAFAVAIDALLLRPFLVPALMKLLGRWNWWPGVARGGDGTTGQGQEVPSVAASYETT